jgi:hypothetical protein
MDERQVHVVEINAPIAEVWAEITKLRQIQKPMFNTVLDTDFKPGWVGILANIKAVVETGNVPLTTRLKHALMSAFMFMAPKETLRENVKELQETGK